MPVAAFVFVPVPVLDRLLHPHSSLCAARQAAVVLTCSVPASEVESAAREPALPERQDETPVVYYKGQAAKRSCQEIVDVVPHHERDQGRVCKKAGGADWLSCAVSSECSFTWGCLIAGALCKELEAPVVSAVWAGTVLLRPFGRGSERARAPSKRHPNSRWRLSCSAWWESGCEGEARIHHQRGLLRRYVCGQRFRARLQPDP